MTLFVSSCGLRVPQYLLEAFRFTYFQKSSIFSATPAAQPTSTRWRSTINAARGHLTCHLHPPQRRERQANESINIATQSQFPQSHPQAAALVPKWSHSLTRRWNHPTRTIANQHTSEAESGSSRTAEGYARPTSSGRRETTTAWEPLGTVRPPLETPKDIAPTDHLTTARSPGPTTAISAGSHTTDGLTAPTPTTPS